MGQADSPAPLLRMTKVSKSFPGVKALADVNFEVSAGEVHALMGENGAGKSTLIKVLTGVHRCDTGRIELDGKVIHPHAPREAEGVGISTVYQEVHLIPHLSVAENIMLGRQPTRGGFVRWKESTQAAEKALQRVDLDIDVQQELCRYSAAVQQMVAIARAVSIDAKLLVLDEPTSSLDEKEVDELFAVLQRLRVEGLGIVFITHFLDQVYRIADRVTVLRGGQRVGVFLTKELPRIELVGKMLGKNPEEVAAIESRSARRRPIQEQGAVALAADELGRQGAVEPFDLRVFRGEVVGLAGLLGSGRTEAIRLFFGLDRATSGTLAIGGQRIERPTPPKCIEAGMAYCPENRQLEGVILDLSVRENILLAMQASRGLARRLPLRKQQDIAEHYIQGLRIKAPSSETPVRTLSGGNQQKVLLARWLAMQPKIILLDEPTRGIDVGAKAEIEALVSSLSDEGMAVVFVSSELEEVVRTCHRVAVFRDRRKIGELEDDQIQESTIMEMIAHHHDN